MILIFSNFSNFSQIPSTKSLELLHSHQLRLPSLHHTPTFFRLQPCWRLCYVSTRCLVPFSCSLSLRSKRTESNHPFPCLSTSSDAAPAIAHGHFLGAPAILPSHLHGHGHPGLLAAPVHGHYGLADAHAHAYPIRR